MRAERAFTESEYSVTDLEGSDTTADRLDDSGKLIPEDRHLWPDQPGEGTAR
jgi:hypothetical protein